MAPRVNLICRTADRPVAIPLTDVVFEGGEPHPGVLVRGRADGREITGTIVAIERAQSDAPADSSTITVEPIDDAILTAESGVSFIGEPPHAAPATDRFDLSVPGGRTLR